MARGIIGSAFIAVKPDTKGFEAGARVGVLGPLKKVAVAAAGIFAAIKVKDFISDAVRGYTDDVNEAYRVTKIFGDQAGAVVKDFANTAATSLGLADDQASHYATQLGQLFVQLGIGKKQAATMSVSFVKLAADMASFANVPVDQAVNALQRGLAGGTRGLKQFGIVIDQNQIKLEAHRLGLIKTVKSALDPAARAQATYSLILKQSGLVQGDFERRSGNLRNTMLRINAEWDVAKDAIGKAFLPIVLQVLHVLADDLPAAIDLAGRAIRGIQSALAPVTSAITGFIATLKPIAAAAQYGFAQNGLAGAVNAAAGALTQLVPQFEPVRAAIATSIGVIQAWKAAFEFKGVEGLLTAIGGRLEILKDDFLKLSDGGKVLAASLAVIGVSLAAAFFPVTAIVVTIAALAGALVYAYKTNETFRNAVQALGAYLQGPGLEGVKQFAAYIQNGLTKAVAYVQALMPDLQKAVQNTVTVITALWERFGPTLVANLKTSIATVKTLIESIAKVVKGVVDVVVGLLSGDWGRAWNGVKEIVSGAIEGVSAVVKGALTNLVRIAAALASAAADAIGAGLKKAAGLAGAAIAAVGAAIAAKAGDFVAKGKQLAESVANGIKTAPAQLAGLAGDLVAKVGGAISQAAGQAYGLAKQIGAKIASGVLDGIGDLGGAIKDKVSSAVSGALSHIDVPGFSPPEHAGAEAVGKPLAQGIIQGFLDGTRDLPAKISDRLKNALEHAKTVVDNQRSALTDSFSALADKAFTAFDATTQAKLDQIGKRFDTLRTKADDGLAKATDKLKAGFDAKTAAIDAALDATNKVIDSQLSIATDRTNQWQKDSDAATAAWAKGQTDSINSALAATLSSIDAWQKQLTPTEALVQQQQSAHDAGQSAQQLADAQQAVADARSQLNTAQAGDASGNVDDAAILAAQKALGDAQRQLAETQFQQTLAQEQTQAQAERAQRDATAEAEKADALAQAQAQIDQINAQAQAQQDAHAAAAAAELAAAQAAADAQRAQAQANHDAAAAQTQAAYDADQARLEVAHDKRIAELDRVQAREQLEYQADRDLLKEHLQKRLDAIEAATVAEKDGWKTHHAAVLKLFHDITGDYQDAGRNLGSAFVQGLRESQGELEGMAARLATAIAAYLRLHSPAKKGPLSTLDDWWKPFAPTLMRGLDTQALSAATTGLRPGAAAGTAGGSYGAVGDPSVLRKLDEVVAAVREHRDGDLTIVAQRSIDLNEIAARAGG